MRRWRIVQLTIAAAMLAVPTSAFAFTGATAADGQSQPSLPIHVTPRHLQYGDTVRVSGTTSPSQAGDPVLLQTAVNPDAAWTTVQRASVASNGGFGFRLKLRHSGVLRVIEPTTSTSANVTSPSIETGDQLQVSGGARVAPVQVTAELHVAARVNEVLAGTPIDISGRLLPALNGRTVVLQGHAGTGWQPLAHGRTHRSGAFDVRYVPSDDSGRQLRVLFAGDRDNARTVAPAGSVTDFTPSVASWYDDAGSTACGFHAGLGVANRTLPCGTKVRIRAGAATVTATVDDRGPFVGGRDWDLNQNTAGALHFGGVGTVWVSVE